MRAAPCATRCTHPVARCGSVPLCTPTKGPLSVVEQIQGDPRPPGTAWITCEATIIILLLFYYFIIVGRGRYSIIAKLAAEPALVASPFPICRKTKRGLLVCNR
jgi:hypothetical protein